MTSIARHKCKEWVEEGEGWAERVGGRYGFFGFEKGSKRDNNSESGSKPRHTHIAGDVANAVVAYGVTKVSNLSVWFPSGGDR